MVLLELGRRRLSRHADNTGDLEGMKEFEGQCTEAARHGARVASLLATGDMIRPRCWVMMYVGEPYPILTSTDLTSFTCFTCCCILLFSASQQLLSISLQNVGRELSYASSYIDVLSRCSYECPAAQRLYHTIRETSNNIRELAYSVVCNRMGRAGLVVSEAEPSGHFDSIEGAREARDEILQMAQFTMNLLQHGINIE